MATPGAAGATAVPASGRVVLLVCLVTGFTTLFDSAALVIATPVLATELGASAGQLQWVLAGYSLTFGMALIPAGRLGDLIGRPVLLASGMALFSGASIVGATAEDATALVVARLVQGVGAGMANPQVIGLLQDRFRGSDRARALGAYMSMGSAGALLAPLVAGAVLSAAAPDVGWRVVVVLNVPLGLTAGLLSVLVLYRRTQSVRGPSRRVDLDLVGLGCVTALTLVLLTPFILRPRATTWVLSALVVLALTMALIGWERLYASRGRLPLITPELARAPGFTWGCLVATFTFGSWLGYTSVLMLFLQQAAGLTPLATGLVTIPSAIASLVCANLAWRVLRRFGRSGVTGLLAAKATISVGAAISVALAPASAVVPILVATQTLTGAVSGLSGSPNQALTLEHAPHDQHGVAAGVLQVSQRISATVCIAALVGAFTTTTGGLATTIEAGRSGLVVVVAASAILAALATVCSALDARHTRARLVGVRYAQP